ncbi:MAG: imidazole glycerol phosphate synthase subunit HisH [Candidatus Merdivicinus sp.]
MITIIDYGAGNLFSVQNALNYLGLENQISRDPAEIRSADGLILPGVGAFPDAMRMLNASGLADIIREEARKKPFLGICLGMQLLFEIGYEFEETKGLGLLPGVVRKIETPYKIPHMGWNSLDFHNPCPLLDGVAAGESVYFVHSFQARTQPECLYATCDYGTEIPALVGEGTVFGAQFHPEKSGETGLTILRNFGRLTR